MLIPYTLTRHKTKKYKLIIKVNKDILERELGYGLQFILSGDNRMNIFGHGKNKKKTTSEWNIECYHLMRKGRYEQALECCETVLELEPKDVSALDRKAKCLEKLNLLEEAIKVRDFELEEHPNMFPALSNEVNDLIKLGRAEEAIERIYKNLHVYEARGKSNYIEFCFSLLLQVNPKRTQAWYDRGNYYAKLKRFDKAIESYDNALKIDPTNEIYKKNRLRALNQKEEAEKRKKMVVRYCQQCGKSFSPEDYPDCPNLPDFMVCPRCGWQNKFPINYKKIL